MKKPIIGVMPLVDDERESLWMLPGYMDGVAAAGGLPIMLPLTSDPEDIGRLTEMCDGFLFTGGHDVSPEIYGMIDVTGTVVSCARRDDMESAVLKTALDTDKPILGICRGIQFINAALGGTLYQDIPSQHRTDTEHHQSPPYDVPIHDVIIDRDSSLYGLIHRDRLAVNSYHHQAIDVISPRLKSMAVSEDGLIEAVEMPGHKFVWALQWHPEFSYLTDEVSAMIFERFVSACG